MAACGVAKEGIGEGTLFLPAHPGDEIKHQSAGLIARILHRCVLDDATALVSPPGKCLFLEYRRGNGIDPSSTDRFGCGHSDDSEAASSQTSNLVGGTLVKLLDGLDGAPERVVVGRYVLPGGTRSRDPLGSPEIKCNVDQTFHPAGPAVAVWVQGVGVVHPAAWMSLSGRRQAQPDRNTRGYLTASGERVWLDVFPEVAG